MNFVYFACIVAPFVGFIWLGFPVCSVHAKRIIAVRAFGTLGSCLAVGVVLTFIGWDGARVLNNYEWPSMHQTGAVLSCMNDTSICNASLLEAFPKTPFPKT
jgi:hypothetical protein